jgi:hypothetical protein
VVLVVDSVVVVVASLPADVVVVAGRLSVVTSGLVVVVVICPAGWKTPEVGLVEDGSVASGSETGSPPPQATTSARLKTRVLVG